MTPELTYLAQAALLTGLLWIPYVLDRLRVRGLADTVGYPERPRPPSPWAERLKAAHANAVENLVVFATLVLIAHAVGIHNDLTRLAGALYVGSRVLHAAAYTFAVPWLRTLGFVGGFVAQLAFAYMLL